MKINIQEDTGCTETEITVRCREMDEHTLRLIAALRAAEQKLAGVKDGRTFVIDPEEVCYFDSVDKRTFLYTGKEVYETPLRLYELEERFSRGDFFRASKSTIINLARIRMLNPMLGGRIEVVLENGEHLMVSRQYVPALKEKLGF